jgi:hypothetical protein
VAVVARPDVRGPRAGQLGDHSELSDLPPRGPDGSRLTDRSVNQAVADKLRRLHTDHGYFTRAEIEAALLGLDSPRGEWVRPGYFDADGRWVRHCGGEAA